MQPLFNIFFGKHFLIPSSGILPLTVLSFIPDYLLNKHVYIYIYMCACTITCP